jgi:hypothetical protein
MEKEGVIMAEPSGTIKIQAGSFDIDNTQSAWFDIRLTDSGCCVSLCDNEQNLRYTAIIDNGKVVFGEIGPLIRSDAMETPETPLPPLEPLDGNTMPDFPIDPIDDEPPEIPE